MSNVSSFLLLSLWRDDGTLFLWCLNATGTARSGDAEKADFFLCSSKVYLNVFPKLILTTKLNRDALKSSFSIRSISWWCLLWWSTNIYLFLWWVNHLDCQKRVLHNQIWTVLLLERIIRNFDNKFTGVVKKLLRHYHVFWTEWCIAPCVGKPVWSRITCFDALIIHCYLPRFYFWIDTLNPSIISWASQ